MSSSIHCQPIASVSIPVHLCRWLSNYPSTYVLLCSVRISSLLHLPPHLSTADSSVSRFLAMQRWCPFEIKTIRFCVHFLNCVGIACLFNYAFLCRCLSITPLTLSLIQNRRRSRGKPASTRTELRVISRQQLPKSAALRRSDLRFVSSWRLDGQNMADKMAPKKMAVKQKLSCNRFYTRALQRPFANREYSEYPNSAKCPDVVGMVSWSPKIQMNHNRNKKWKICNS